MPHFQVIAYDYSLDKTGLFTIDLSKVVEYSTNFDSLGEQPEQTWVTLSYGETSRNRYLAVNMPYAEFHKMFMWEMYRVEDA